MQDVLFAIWFLLPAGLANSSPLLLNKLPLIKKIDTPVDFGYTFRGKRIFGENKRWRGLIFGAIIGAIVGLIQYYLNPSFINDLSINTTNPALFMSALGALQGFGALFGDAVESFFKRQRDIKPGQSWFPFDQIDFILGACLFSSILVVLSIKEYLIILLVWWALHVISTYFGYLLGIRDQAI